MTSAPASAQAENVMPLIHDIRPLVLETGSFLMRKLNERAFSERIAYLRKKVALSLGIVFPGLSVRENPFMEPRGYVIKVREVGVVEGKLRLSARLSYSLSEMERQIAQVIHQYSHEFLGSEEVQELLENLRRLHPRLVEEVTPSPLSLPEIQHILQNLLREGIPIRDLPKIFEALQKYSTFTRDPEILTEYVRHAMSRLLGSLYHDSSVIRAYTLDQSVEQIITGAIRWNEGTFLDLDLKISERIEKALTKKFRAAPRRRKQNTVLLVSPGIRRFVRILVEWLAPGIPVLSSTEIAREYRLKTVGVISLDEPESFKLFVSRRKMKRNFPGDNLQKALLVLDLIGPALNGVGESLTPGQKQALTGRAVIAPVPSYGKEQVLEEFMSCLPPEKNVRNRESLCKLALDEPALIASTLQKNWLAQFENPSGTRIFSSELHGWQKKGKGYDYYGTDDLGKIGYGMLQFPFGAPQTTRGDSKDQDLPRFVDTWWDGKKQMTSAELNEAQLLALLLLSLSNGSALQSETPLLGNRPGKLLHEILREQGDSVTPGGSNGNSDKDPVNLLQHIFFQSEKRQVFQRPNAAESELEDEDCLSRFE